MREVEDYGRKFLVVIDGTRESARAVAFAAYRVRRTGGTVVLLFVIEPTDFQHWMGVEDVMRAEALEEAESQLDAAIAQIKKIGNLQIETVIREGRRTEEIEALIAQDPGIAILVLAASVGGEGPGPLVTAFATRSGGNGLHIPVTIIPGMLTDAEIEAIC